jgi:hypothetical protein
MPRSFDDVLTIDPEGNISPSGPLELVKGETVEKLYAWVFQLNHDGTGAACIAAQPSPGKLASDDWVTEPNSTDHAGRFQPGAATGIAVTISTDAGGRTKVFWWSETISVA